VQESRGELHGFLSDRDVTRAIIAKWWNVTPFDIRRYPLRVYREMAEFRTRVLKAEADAIEATKRGAPTPGRGPQPSQDDW
jgi:hypothetical protein